MRKLFLSLIAALVIATPCFAGKLTVGTTNNGQFTDLKISGASTSTTKVTGNEATIDLSTLSQSSTSLTTTAVLNLSQSATIAPVLAITCTAGGGVGASNTNTCGSYTSTGASKVGSIKIYVNGAARYIDLKSAPN